MQVGKHALRSDHPSLPAAPRPRPAGQPQPIRRLLPTPALHGPWVPWRLLQLRCPAGVRHCLLSAWSHEKHPFQASCPRSQSPHPFSYSPPHPAPPRSTSTCSTPWPSTSGGATCCRSRSTSMSRWGAVRLPRPPCPPHATPPPQSAPCCALVFPRAAGQPPAGDAHAAHPLRRPTPACQAPTHPPHSAPTRPHPPTLPAQVLAIMDESIQVYSPELLQNRIAILRWGARRQPRDATARQGRWSAAGAPRARSTAPGLSPP